MESLDSRLVILESASQLKGSKESTTEEEREFGEKGTRRPKWSGERVTLQTRYGSNDAMRQLKQLKEEHSFFDYVDSSVLLVSEVDLPDEDQVALFVKGLKKDNLRLIMVLAPKTLQQAIFYAKTLMNEVDPYHSEARGREVKVFGSDGTNWCHVESKLNYDEDIQQVSSNARNLTTRRLEPENRSFLIKCAQGVLGGVYPRSPDSEDEDKKSEAQNNNASTVNLSLSDVDFNSLQIMENKDLEELKELGSGTFGTVYHGRWRDTDVAIKHIKKSCFTGRSSEQEGLIVKLWRETDILSKRHHSMVVAFYGIVEDDPGGTLATITEPMVKGSLRHVFLTKDRDLDCRKRLLMAIDAAFGMEDLRPKNIVHFDLKYDNLLVIPQFNSDLQDAVCLFYLVLRAFDTVENDTGIVMEVKVPILKVFHQHVYDKDWHLSDGTKRCKVLMDQLHHVFTIFLELGKGFQEAIENITRKMNAGRAKFICKEVETTDDYDEYCYYVAGLIGLGLSKLFHASKSEDLTSDTLSNSMGLFLQKINIIRDYLDDPQLKSVIQHIEVGQPSTYEWTHEFRQRRDHSGVQGTNNCVKMRQQTGKVVKKGSKNLGESSKNDSSIVRRPAEGMVLQILHVIKIEGWEGLYSRLKPSMLEIAALQSVRYYFYKVFKNRAEAIAPSHRLKRRANETIGMFSRLVVATLAGFLKVLLTNPIWVLVTCMQTHTQAEDGCDDSTMEVKLAELESAKPRPYGTLHAAQEVYSEARLTGFWKDIIPILIMVCNLSIQFIIYEISLKNLKARHAVNKKNAKDVSAWEFFLSGGLAKLGATIATYHVLVVKSRLQAKQEIGKNFASRCIGTLDAIIQVIRYEGLAGFYKGMSAKIVQSVFAASVLIMLKEELMKADMLDLPQQSKAFAELSREVNEMVQLAFILDRKMAERDNKAATKVLIPWSGKDSSQATWQFSYELQQVPGLHTLEDKGEVRKEDLIHGIGN